MLPIDSAIAEIRDRLAANRRLVLAAPPGAGKTTRLPLAILEEPWLAGRRAVLLEPRRIAARMAAERMAGVLGERVGATVGLSTRVDRLVSAKTRIEIVTDGLVARRLVADPELSGTGALLFDEFHERSLAADLALALALDAQGALRPDLRIIVMSATLDVEAVARRIDAPHVVSSGRQFDIRTIYLGRPAARLEDAVAAAVRRALRENAGSALVFLPGRGEILRLADRLVDLPADVDVAPLYGALSPPEQNAAVAPASSGKRKVVLATDIAESSLTIEGVSIVIDAGLSRESEFDAESGSRLVTVKASRASVDQRRGRAGRLGPGVCYRLWDENDTRGLLPAPRPEILAADLSGLALTLAEWGERDAARLVWIDPPPEGRLALARSGLVALGALDGAGRITEFGRAVARLPFEPRLAAMIAGETDPARRALAGEIAVLLSERGLGGVSVDLRDRIARFRRERSPRAAALRAQAARWSGGGAPAAVEEAGRILARARPERIARVRGGEPGLFLMANGRAARLDADDPFAREAWLAVADATGARSGARILAAAPISETDAVELGPLETIDEARFDSGAIKARRIRRIGAIVLSETPLAAAGGAAAVNALVCAVREYGLDLLPAADSVREMQARIAFARAQEEADWPDWSDAALLEDADAWLPSLLGDPPRLDRPNADEVRRALLDRLSWAARRRFEDLAPTSVAAGHRAFPIDYRAEGGPRIEARVQEFYGLKVHPAIAGGRVALAVSLLSPAKRQIALTRDLPAFWAAGYHDMAKDMRGRYPKHDWPEDPSAARPHEGRTKARLAADGGGPKGKAKPLP